MEKESIKDFKREKSSSEWLEQATEVLSEVSYYFARFVDHFEKFVEKHKEENETKK